MGICSISLFRSHCGYNRFVFLLVSTFWVSPRERGETLFFWLLSTRKPKKVSPTDLNAPNRMRNASAFAELTIKERRRTSSPTFFKY